MSRPLLSLATVVALLSSATSAWADVAADDAATPDKPIDLTMPVSETIEPNVPADDVSYPERRCGFTMGIMPTAILGASTGYPNDALRIGLEEHFTDTGFSGGGAAFGWIGIAMTDWLVFGVGGNYGLMYSDEHETTFGGAAFHIDAFPLFGLGDEWQDVGVAVEVGISFNDTRLLGGGAGVANTIVVDAGIGSRVSIGAFYEGIRAWKLAMGPYLAVDTIFSQSAVRPVAAIGWRTAFYGGP